MVVPTLDPEAAVAEIERLGDHPQIVQVLLPVRTRRPVGQHAHRPVLRGGRSHGLVVGLHAWGRVGNAPTPSGLTHTYLEDYLAQLADHGAGASDQPGHRGRVRALPGAAGHPAGVRLLVAADAAVALRQGLEGRLA